MKRDLNRIDGHTFDLLIIGAGIYGAAVAREAALQGLSVALVEKHDFGNATSSNSLKIIHGGLRYLQCADIKRMRRSIVARRTLLKIAPHLVKPLKFVLPTIGNIHKGRPALFIALLLNDIISWDRNFLIEKSHRIHRGAVLTKREFLKLAPGINSEGCSGGAVWYDAVATNTERLTLEFVCSAVDHGACAVNYVEVEGLSVENGKVRGATAVDQLTGRTISIRAKFTVNASGPNIEQVARRSNLISPVRLKWAKAVNIFVKKKIFNEYAVGFYSRDDFQAKGAGRPSDERVFFCVPWKGGTMIGTTYKTVTNSSEGVRVSGKDVDDLIGRFDQRWPGVGLTFDDVGFCHLGLVPVERTSLTDAGSVRLGYRSIFIDHYKKDGIGGLMSLAGVKYTTAVIEAQGIVAKICKKAGHINSKKKMEHVLPGGRRYSSKGVLGAGGSKYLNDGLNPNLTNRLIIDYGAISWKIIGLAEENPGMLEPVIENAKITVVEVVYFAREEMARKVADVLLRRTNIGWFGYPGCNLIERCAEIMGKELGWDSKRKLAEIDDANKVFEDLNRFQHLK